MKRNRKKKERCKNDTLVAWLSSSFIGGAESDTRGGRVREIGLAMVTYLLKSLISREYTRETNASQEEARDKICEVCASCAC